MKEKRKNKVIDLFLEIMDKEIHVIDFESKGKKTNRFRANWGKKNKDLIDEISSKSFFLEMSEDEREEYYSLWNKISELHAKEKIDLKEDERFDVYGYFYAPKMATKELEIDSLYNFPWSYFFKELEQYLKSDFSEEKKEVFKNISEILKRRDKSINFDFDNDYFYKELRGFLEKNTQHINDFIVDNSVSIMDFFSKNEIGEGNTYFNSKELMSVFFNSEDSKIDFLNIFNEVAKELIQKKRTSFLKRKNIKSNSNSEDEIKKNCFSWLDFLSNKNFDIEKAIKLDPYFYEKIIFFELNTNDENEKEYWEKEIKNNLVEKYLEKYSYKKIKFEEIEKITEKSGKIKGSYGDFSFNKYKENFNLHSKKNELSALSLCFLNKTSITINDFMFFKKFIKKEKDNYFKNGEIFNEWLTFFNNSIQNQIMISSGENNFDKRINLSAIINSQNNLSIYTNQNYKYSQRLTRPLRILDEYIEKNTSFSFEVLKFLLKNEFSEVFLKNEEEKNGFSALLLNFFSLPLNGKIKMKMLKNIFENFYLENHIKRMENISGINFAQILLINVLYIKQTNEQKNNILQEDKIIFETFSLDFFKWLEDKKIINFKDFYLNIKPFSLPLMEKDDDLAINSAEKFKEFYNNIIENDNLKKIVLNKVKENKENEAYKINNKKSLRF